MRMISDRDERIVNELAKATDNDMEIVRQALAEVDRRSRSEGRKFSMNEAVEIARRLLGESRVGEAA